MKPRRVIAPRDAAEIFDRAVRDRALAVLSLQEGTDWISFKSRFLERDSHGRFFVLDHQQVGDEPLPDLSPGQYVGVSFRYKSRKVLFATVVEAKGHFVLDDQTTVPAVRFRWPETITELQRRAYYRTPVPEEMTIVANMWPGGITGREQAQSGTMKIITGHLADLSCGGAMVRVQNPAAFRCGEDEILGVELQLPDGKPPVLVDCRHRGLRQDEQGVSGVAVQFVGLEMAPDGRVVLERLSKCVQRLHRLGMASGQKDWGNRPRS
jgi:c-di-GMP-binding flagellar brake protein YcgR